MRGTNMKNLVNELKNLYQTAADKLWELKQEYADIQRTLRGEASFEEKSVIAGNFSDFDYAEIKKHTNEVKKAIDELVDKEEYMQIINSDEEVKKAYNWYLFALEEAEYMYPHAKGAVQVFLRDNEISAEQ